MGVDPELVQRLKRLQGQYLRTACSFGSCDRKPTAKGLCDTHWTQQHKGQPLRLIRTYDRHSNESTCPEQGCPWPFSNKNFCAQHEAKREEWPYARRYRLAYVFDMTPEDFEAKAQAQNGKCAVCLRPEKTLDPRSRKLKALSMDHNHRHCKMGCPSCQRDLLCQRCNTGLGLYDDDPSLLLDAVEYLMRHSM
jgi:hypothetical protein